MDSAIAQRALRQVGTPYRLHGRVPDIGLDCVGLVGHALALDSLPERYSLRGDHADFAAASLKNFGGTLHCPNAKASAGDIAVALCSPRQLHLLVRVEDGWVHAHAGLRRVVRTPDPLPWPVLQIWRFEG